MQRLSATVPDIQILKSDGRAKFVDPLRDCVYGDSVNSLLCKISETSWDGRTSRYPTFLIDFTIGDK